MNSPVHAITNTYETNRDVLLTKQNAVTVGSNANSTISQFTYTVNSIGQRIFRQQSGLAFATASTDAFSYNTRGEVANSTNTLTPFANRAYSYDPIGNRLFATEGSVGTPSTNPTTKTYLSNALNQYTQINTDVPSAQPSRSTATPTYDLDGNMLTDGTGKSYTWDAENRLIQVTLTSGEIVKYFYDSNSRRIKREHITATTPITTTTTLYLYDSWNVISEKTTVPNTEMSPATKTYHWGLDLSNTLQSAGGVGGLLRTTYRPATADDTPSIPQLHYHLYDANGNISELLSSSAAITAHYECDPFGKELLSIGSFSTENTYRFSTKPRDVISDLAYYGHRFYSPGDGRWINRDPKEFLIEAHLEVDEEFQILYSQSRNDTINNFDFLGLVPMKDTFWAIYPNYKTYDGKSVWETVIKGEVGKWGMRRGPLLPENSCAARVSYVLNAIKGGKEKIVPTKDEKQMRNTEKGGGTPGWYIVSARLMKGYLTRVWGKKQACSDKEAYYFKSKVHSAPTESNRSAQLKALREEILAVVKKCNCGTDYVAVVSYKGHVGVITPTYEDPFTPYEPDGDVWILPPTSKQIVLPPVRRPQR